VKVLINAISIKEGGSLVVLDQLLRAMTAQRPDIEWHAAIHPNVAGRSMLPEGVTPWTFPQIDRSLGHPMYWYEVALPHIVRRIGADILFSQTNYLPHRRTTCPALLLEQNAGHFSAEFKQLMERNLAGRLPVWAWRRKGAWVRNSVRKADRVIVQTSALAVAIHAQVQVPEERLEVVSHGPGLVAHADGPHLPPEGKSWRIGYVSKFGVQKDFETALRALRELRARGRTVTLVLTLDEAVPGVAVVRNLIAELGVAGSVENRGELGIESMQSLYDDLDAFVFPSRCESFGFPLVEAMARGLPVVVARIPSNVEIAGAGVLTFAPGDWQVLSDTVECLMSDPAVYRAQAGRSLAAAREFSWSRAATGTLDAIERTVRR
jgi:glycosyltransferase involved in cell wall biosynthesis